MQRTSASNRPEPITIELTPDQARQLEAHFEHAQADADRGLRGILVAQVWQSFGEAGGKPALRVGFVPHDVARQIEGTAR